MFQVYSRCPASEHLISKYSPESQASSAVKKHRPRPAVTSIDTTSPDVTRVRTQSPKPAKGNPDVFSRVPTTEVTYPAIPPSASSTKSEASSSKSSESSGSTTRQRRPSYHRERPQRANRPPFTRAAPFSTVDSSRSTSSYQSQPIEEKQKLRPYLQSRQASDSASFYTCTSSPDSESDQASSSYLSSPSSHSSRDDDFNDKLPRRMRPHPALHSNQLRFPARQNLQGEGKDSQSHKLLPHHLARPPHLCQRMHNHFHHGPAQKAQAPRFEHKTQAYTPPSQPQSYFTYKSLPKPAAKSNPQPEKRVHFEPEALDAKNGHHRYMSDIRGEWDRVKHRGSRSRPRSKREEQRDYDGDTERDDRRRRHHGRSSRRRRD